MLKESKLQAGSELLHAKLPEKLSTTQRWFSAGPADTPQAEKPVGKRCWAVTPYNFGDITFFWETRTTFHTQNSQTPFWVILLPQFYLGILLWVDFWFRDIVDNFIWWSALEMPNIWFGLHSDKQTWWKIHHFYILFPIWALPFVTLPCWFPGSFVWLCHSQLVDRCCSRRPQTFQRCGGIFGVLSLGCQARNWNLDMRPTMHVFDVCVHIRSLICDIYIYIYIYNYIYIYTHMMHTSWFQGIGSCFWCTSTVSIYSCGFYMV